MRNEICKLSLIGLLDIICVSLLLTGCVKAQGAISRGQVITDRIPRGQTKIYYLSETFTKGTLIVLSVKRVSGEGTFRLMRGSEVVGEYSIYSHSDSYPIKLNFYPFVLPESGAAYLFNVSSYSYSNEDFAFSFSYDTTDVLKEQNSKSIPIEGGAVGYYIDMKQGDKLSLTLKPPEDAEYDLLIVWNVLWGYPYIGPFSMINTFFTPSPKETSFTAEYTSRYYIFVVATRLGSHPESNFSLTSIYSANPTQQELTYFKFLSYILLAVSIILLVITVTIMVLLARLRKQLQQAAAQPTALH